MASKIVSDTSCVSRCRRVRADQQLPVRHPQRTINGDQGDVKIDWNITDKDRIFGRYSQSNITNPSTNNVPIFYNWFANYPTHNGVLDWTRTIIPTLVNDARVGVNYVFVNNGAAGNGWPIFPQTVGLPGTRRDILPAHELHRWLCQHHRQLAITTSSSPTP